MAGVFAVRPEPLANLDAKACDVLTGWADRGRQSGRVAVVEIDDKSLADFGRWPWPRDLLGKLVKATADAGAAMVVLDVILSEEDPGRPGGGTGRGTNDEALAEALAKVPSVTGYSMTFSETAPGAECSPPPLPLVVAGPEARRGDTFYRASGVECTVAAVAGAAAGAGFLNAAPDRDGRLRRLPLVIQYREQYYPSAALAALNLHQPVARMQYREAAGGGGRLRLDAESIALESQGCLRLRYRGPRRTFPYLAASDLLRGRAGERLSGRIAVIGASAGGLQSAAATPVDMLLPLVEVQATAIDNLLQGDAIYRPSEGYFWELGLALAAGVLSAAAIALIRSLWGGLITVGLVAGIWGGCALALSATGLMLSPLPATGVLACNFVALTMLNYRTERKRAERTEALRLESESRYQRLVENIDDAIITTDRERRLVFANRRFREWFGIKEGETGGVLLESCVAPEWRAAVREQHRRRMAGEAAADHLEWEGIRADGSRIWVEALMTTVEEAGRIVGTQSALRDVTERKRLEAQYLQAQKMESVGRLAGGVAHDFNNLLTVINGYSELLASKLAGNAQLGEIVAQIHHAGERAAELTMQLLTFSRKQAAQAKPLDLNLVLEDAEKLLRRVLGEDIDLVSIPGEGLGRVLADRGQMQQVLMNLVVNARDSMPDGGTLTIETRNMLADDVLVAQHPELKPGRYVHLCVTDTGIGMTDEVLRQVFEPFFTTKEKGKGTGLGLATVQRIVRQCGGAIRVESEVGKGARFHLYFPRTEAAVQAAAGGGGSVTVARGSETVLVVEDQAAVRQLTEEILRSHGYEVLEAGSGPQAMELAAGYAGKIDLLITDVVLPHMNGRALAESLQRARPEMKVLYISGYSEETVGGLSYLAKPYSAEALAAKVRETLGG